MCGKSLLTGTNAVSDLRLAQGVVPPFQLAGGSMHTTTCDRSMAPVNDIDPRYGVDTRMPFESQHVRYDPARSVVQSSGMQDSDVQRSRPRDLAGDAHRGLARVAPGRPCGAAGHEA
jgi:hypothetical protein